jgi:hypothetical protein
MFRAETSEGLIANLMLSQRIVAKMNLYASSNAAGTLLCGRRLQPADQRRP